MNTFDVGYGSGGAVKAPYLIKLLDALLKKAKLEMELVELYRNWCNQNVIPEAERGKWPLCLKYK